MDEAEINRRAAEAADLFVEGPMKQVAIAVATFVLNKLGTPVEEPVDPDLIEARRIAAKGGDMAEAATLAGQWDNSLYVQNTLAGIKLGRELEREEEYGGRPPRSNISENLRAYLERNAAPPIPPADGPTVRFKSPGRFHVRAETYPTEACRMTAEEYAQRFNQWQRNIEGQP